jgi:hypothetical protein
MSRLLTAILLASLVASCTNASMYEAGQIIHFHECKRDYVVRHQADYCSVYYNLTYEQYQAQRHKTIAK